MIPTTSGTQEESIVEFEYKTQPDYSYKLNIESECIASYVDGLNAYKQAVYKILNTERYEHLIYSWNYGVELKNLMGKPLSYVIPELEVRIKEAVMQDDRTENVYGFQFEQPKRGVLHVTFYCKSTLGTVLMEKDIDL